ncbi:MAG: HAD family hydrolase [Deltaproteobacteria bacterium]|nr:HAD family hydrolase [Deltaproteobacteria bacterium]
MPPAVFLDRDGVINKTQVRDGRPYAPRLIEEFALLPGVNEAIGKLKGFGFRVIVVTNQPDVRTGKTALATVQAMHKIVLEQLGVDAIKVCYHVDQDACACRKPKPGMLLEAAKEWDIDLVRSFMVGDRWRDIEAGQAAGCRTVLVGQGYDGEKKVMADFEVASLLEASHVILKAGGRAG